MHGISVQNMAQLLPSSRRLVQKVLVLSGKLLALSDELTDQDAVDSKDADAADLVLRCARAMASSCERERVLKQKFGALNRPRGDGTSQGDGTSHEGPVPRSLVLGQNSNSFKVQIIDIACCGRRAPRWLSRPPSRRLQVAFPVASILRRLSISSFNSLRLSNGSAKLRPWRPLSSKLIRSAT